MEREIRKKKLIFGFVTLFLCGIGDWFIGYQPSGGESIIFGYIKTSMVEIPSWFYILSMIFGVLSGFGCKTYSPVMLDILKTTGMKEESRMYKCFRFGISSAPLMFVSFHTACCVAVLFMQAALKTGITSVVASQEFTMPVLVSIIPFTVWCFVVDIPVTIAFMYFTLSGKLRIPKAMFVFCPLGLSILTKLIAGVLILMGLNPMYIFLAGCGESWGWAFMCLAFLKVSNKLE